EASGISAPKIKETSRINPPQIKDISRIEENSVINAPASRTTNAPSSGTTQERPVHLLALSARSDTALKELARSFQEMLSLNEKQPHDLPDICFSANTGRNHFEHRLAIQSSSTSELEKSLDIFLNADDPDARNSSGISRLPNSVHGLVPKVGIGRIACFFTDDVPVELVRSLGENQPKIAYVLNRFQTLAKKYLNRELLFEPDDKVSRFACQYAIAELWLGFGLKPAAVCGVCTGELVASCCAGVFDIEEAFQVLAGKDIKRRSPVIRTGSTPAQIASDGNYKVLLAVGTSGTLSGFPDWKPLLPEKTQNPWQWTIDLLADLYVKGLAVDWKGFDAGYSRKRVRLPSYPFQRRRFWLDPSESKDLPAKTKEIAQPDISANIDDDMTKSVPDIALKALASTDKPVTPPTDSADKPVTPPTDSADKPVTPPADSADKPVTPPTGYAVAAPVDIARLMNHQMENAASMIYGIVDQQLAFLKRTMSNRPQSIVDTVHHHASGDAPSVPEAGKNDSTNKPGSIEILSDKITGKPETISDVTARQLPDEPEQEKKEPEKSIRDKTSQNSDSDKNNIEPDKNRITIALGKWKLMLISRYDNTTGSDTVQAPAITRQMLVFEDKNEVKDKNGIEDKKEIDAALAAQDSKNIITAKVDRKRSLIMMFPGVGDHYLNMGRGLYENEPVFRAEIDRCCNFLEPELGINLRKVLYPVATPDMTRTVPSDKNSLNQSEKTASSGSPAKPRMDFRAMLGRGTAPTNPDEER
ncbi:MAG: hypothetical protein HQK61_12310, partial [Desulfamplus sp.]|nr:hypothetical protein [Desulfamplus sp.]